MRPLRLHLTNFLSHTDTNIALSTLSAAVILGPNGAGKTSIVEAIGWSLFGKGRGRGPDDFVSNGATSCSVTFAFAVNGHPYEVTRQRQLGANGKSDLTLLSWEQWVETESGHADNCDCAEANTTCPVPVPVAAQGFAPVGGSTIAETQAAIEDLLGLDYETWLSTSFIGQGKADAFTSLRSAERKQLLFDVLQLAEWQGLAEEAKEIAKTRDAAVMAANAKAEGLREGCMGGVSEGDLAEARTSLASAEEVLASADEARSKAREALEAHKRETVEASDLDERIARANGDVEAARNEAAASEKIAGELAHAVVSIAPFGQDIAENKTQQEEAEAEIVRADAAMAEFEGEARDAHNAARGFGERHGDVQTRLATLQAHPDSRCFTCEQELPAAKRDDLIDALEREAAELIKRRTESDSNAIDAKHRAEERKTQAAKQRARLGQLRGEEADLQRNLTNLQGLLAREDEIAERKLAAVDRLAKAVKTQTDLAELAKLQAAAPDVSAHLAVEAREAEQAYSHRMGYVKDLTSALARMEAAFEREQKGAAELEALETELDKLTEDARIASAATAMFGRDGIPMIQVEKSIPQLEDYANRWLAKLTDEQFNVRLESQRAKKTGGIKETLDILVYDGTDERLLEELSGGERQCVDLALRLALARLLAHRAGRQIQTLVLDEAFTALDSGRRQRAIEVIHALTEEFDLLLMVSHLQEFADVFPARLEVSKTDDGSHVEVFA